MLAEFSLKLLYSIMCLKNVQVYGVYIPRKCIDSTHFYSCPFPLKTRPQVLVITPYAEVNYISGERCGGNFDLLFQNSVRKYETLQYLEH